MTILSEGYLPASNTFELIESEGQPARKRWYIEGVFAQADVVNKNRRKYPKKVMDASVQKYIEQYVNQGRGVGELDHPPSLTVSLERIATKIESIETRDKDYWGKARVLDTPQGIIAQKLLEDGIRIGVSTRGYGSTKNDASGITIVGDDYTIIAIDPVFHPSAPDALVTGLMEGQDWLWDRSNQDIMLLESIRDDILRTNQSRLEEQKLIAFKRILGNL